MHIKFNDLLRTLLSGQTTRMTPTLLRVDTTGYSLVQISISDSLTKKFSLSCQFVIGLERGLWDRRLPFSQKLISQSNIIVCHTLREGNLHADFMANLGAYVNMDLLIHTSPPEGLLDLLKRDTIGTFFPRK
ncbi:hypothetical protein MTR_8g063800 [Medicago truncatula]|uniref:RNase H type-1 domain-containing protein n=1 Tax=Medicago truncatula TaxID=3880 RepID=A0A072TS02_MEDTR|nr:hypothetical protein MTR_8g063800 [Medicago truncatula]